MSRGQHITVAGIYRDDILALRARGLGYRAIAEALAHFHGIPVLSESQIKHELRKAGYAPRRQMVRAHLPGGAA